MRSTLTFRATEEQDTPQVRYAARLVADKLAADLRSERSQVAAGLYYGDELLLSLDALSRICEEACLSRYPSFPRLRNPTAGDTARPRLDLEIDDAASRVGFPAVERPLRVLLTHDVDRVTFSEPTTWLKTIRFWGNRAAGYNPGIRAVLNSDTLFANLQRLLKLEADYGVRALYFMLAGPYGLGRYSARYSLKWREAANFIAAITSAGNEIGLHGSYDACERELYRREAAALSEATGAPVRCHRNHYLRFRPEFFWDRLEAAGIKYDFSVGYTDQPGYVSGLTGPYQTFSPQRREETGVQAIPLVFMERPHHIANPDATLKTLERILTAAGRVGGWISIQFHPERFSLDEGWYFLYRSIIELCLEKGADLSGVLPGDDPPAVGMGEQHGAGG